MYLPSHFDAQADAPSLQALLARDPFITLISTHQGQPLANHLPVLLDQSATGQWRLRGHWARANPQWQGIEEQSVLAIVHGPHAYVSPRWYPDPQRAVPTWNYAAAHLSGRIRLVTDAQPLLALVDALARHFEPSEAPWRMDDALEAAQRMAVGIVGFELTVDSLQIKHKLSQNHSVERIRGVVAGLGREGGAAGAEVAQMMSQALAQRDK